MIDVLHLIDTYRIGGPGKTVLNSARFIDTRRYRVHVGSFLHPDSSKNEFHHAAETVGVPFLPLPEISRLGTEHLGGIRRYVRRHGISIVHAHGYRTDVFTLVACLGLGVATATTHHGWIRNTPHEARMAGLAIQLSRFFDGVEVVSRLLLGELPASMQRSGRAELVHNGIVVADYRVNGRRDEMRARLKLPSQAVALGVVGRLSVEKGCLEMLDAFAAIHRAHPDTVLVMVGEGALRAELEQRAAALGLGTAMCFAGHQTPMQPCYEALDMIVSPSRTEGLPNVLLEAMAMRLPIVATSVGGTPELVEDGANGLLVPAEQPERLAAAVNRLLGDTGLRARLVSGGTRRVDEEFSFDARMRKEEAFYERMLDRKGMKPLRVRDVTVL